MRSYEAPEDREDVFSRRACPAFLSFSNTAYLAGFTVELACLCKPAQVVSHTPRMDVCRVDVHTDSMTSQHTDSTLRDRQAGDSFDHGSRSCQVREVVWFYRKHQAGPEATRALTDHHGNRFLDPDDVPSGADLGSRFSIRLFSLLLYRAEPGDSGLYICGSANQDFFYGYDLDIQEVDALALWPR